MDGTDAFYASLKSASPFFLMAGPNVIQSEEHIFRMCRSIKRITDEVGIPLVFKSSFDKANRTSAKSFRGPGMDEGLKILRAAKTTFDVPIVTDVHDASQAEPVGSVADVIQIPAFLCRQTDLLTAAAKTGGVIATGPRSRLRSAALVRLIAAEPRGEARRAQVDAQHVLEQLDDLGGLGVAAIGRASLAKRLLDHAREFERRLEFPPELHREAQILEREVH